ncbi:unnamed protein product [Spirodela intermedia]|uniref:Uncharacterized protein n=1 Tax=Spirodela intermedia TaxID=51605 RepID=A0A7I8JH53_SPIIN|nr:unnamed protein product [Spirodela intermedia]CAA6669489.1 unnamed protein product [Spirodela intermedia]
MLLPLVSLLLCPALFAFLSAFRSKLLQALKLSPSFSPLRRLPLPPGSMGWPYIGETFQIYSKNPIAFFSHKQKRSVSLSLSRCGPSAGAGRRIADLKFMTPSSHSSRHLCRQVRAGVQDAHAGMPLRDDFQSGGGQVRLVYAGQALQAHLPRQQGADDRAPGHLLPAGPYHNLLRRLVLRAFSAEAIRHKVAGVEATAVEALRSWDGRLINAYQEMKSYAFNVALVSIFGREDIFCTEELKQSYYALERGYNSMPINLPGTLFHDAMRSRRRLERMLSEIIASRRQRGAEATDLLGSLMDNEKSLSDEQISDNIIGVIFAARDTTASVITWLLKYLAEDPKLLEAVTEEQEEIRRSKREGEDECLTWDDIRKMQLTSRVFQETLRAASILSFTFREAVEDVEYEGWKVMPLFRNIHHSPDFFPNPRSSTPPDSASLCFQVTPKPNTFMPFGNGAHSCPGNELAKLEVLVLFHHLTTKYRWSLTESKSGVQFSPFAIPMNGLPIRLSLKA